MCVLVMSVIVVSAHDKKCFANKASPRSSAAAAENRLRPKRGDVSEEDEDAPQGDAKGPKASALRKAPALHFSGQAIKERNGHVHRKGTELMKMIGQRRLRNKSTAITS